MEFLTKLNGLNYDELSRTLQRKIDETQIVAYLIKPGTPAKVKYNIFKRINTGGLVLEPQEIRHALNQGIPAKFVADLATLEEFRHATEYKIKTSRMLDREFVTRFIAFYINEPESYKPDLDSFLNDSMAALAEMTEKERLVIKNNFRASMKLAYDIFEDWSFRKADLYPDRKKPINKALFEVWSVNLAKLNNDERVIIYDKRDIIWEKFLIILKEYDTFWNAITSATGDKQRVIERFRIIKELLRGILK